MVYSKGTYFLAFVMAFVAFGFAIWYVELNDQGELKIELNGQGELKVELNDQGELKVVLAAGSAGYKNYGLQADICHAYQLLRQGGVKKNNIVVMMADDIARDPRNPERGVIKHSPRGLNVYEGVRTDYSGEDLTLENLIAVLSGNKSLTRGGSGRVLSSRSNDRVFLYISAHGKEGLIIFDAQALTRVQLFSILQKNYNQEMYKSMVVYVGACFSGSVFKSYHKQYERMNIYIVTSGNSFEYSKFTTPNDYYNTSLGTMFGVYWIKDSEKHDRRTRF